MSEVQRRVVDPGYPRLLILLMLSASGAVAFLSSVMLQRVGLGLGLRYSLAAAIGYGGFLASIRLWIAYKRGQRDLDIDVPDVGSIGSPEATRDLFAGGRSGGGGGGAQWDTPATSVSGTASIHPSTDGGGWAASLDWDELWPVAIALIGAFCSVLALAFVVYAAPVLLAEVALDGAVVGVVYSRLRKTDARSWIVSAVRRTWLPALAVVAAVGVAGWLLQRAVPEAVSIGGVLRALRY